MYFCFVFFKLNFNGFSVFKRNSREGAFIYVVCNCGKVENNLMSHINECILGKKTKQKQYVIRPKYFVSQKKIGGRSLQTPQEWVTVQ